MFWRKPGNPAVSTVRRELSYVTVRFVPQRIARPGKSVVGATFGCAFVSSPIGRTECCGTCAESDSASRQVQQIAQVYSSLRHRGEIIFKAQRFTRSYNQATSTWTAWAGDRCGERSKLKATLHDQMTNASGRSPLIVV